jgi:hypothetical protein
MEIVVEVNEKSQERRSRPKFKVNRNWNVSA